MGEDTYTGGLALSDDQAAEARLSPAEVHSVLRQRLERLTRPWGLSAADLHNLIRQAPVRTFDSGEIILPRGVRADCLGVVVQGQVAVYDDQRGINRLVRVLMPGSTFGEEMLAAGRPNQSTLRALTHCEIQFLRRADLQALRDEAKTEQQEATLWRLVGASAWLLVVLLLAVVALSLPYSRAAIALLPMGIGQWCSQQELDGCSESAWKTASNLVPDDPNPLLALGGHYYERGEVASAERLFGTAVAQAPDSPEAHNNLGLVYAQQGRHQEAINAFEEALSLEPGIAATEHNLGLSLQSIDAHQEAIAHYQTALALGEPLTSTLVNLAIAYYEAGEPAKAADAAREALLYDESLAPAHTVLGAVALASRQPEKALAHLQQAIALDAGYGQAHFYLGLAYKSVAQPAGAIAAFERALVVADDEVMRVRIRRHLNELYEEERRRKSP